MGLNVFRQRGAGTSQNTSSNAQMAGSNTAGIKYTAGNQQRYAWRNPNKYAIGGFGSMPSPSIPKLPGLDKEGIGNIEVPQVTDNTDKNNSETAGGTPDAGTDKEFNYDAMYEKLRGDQDKAWQDRQGLVNMQNAARSRQAASAAGQMGGGYGSFAMGMQNQAAADNNMTMLAAKSAQDEEMRKLQLNYLGEKLQDQRSQTAFDREKELTRMGQEHQVSMAGGNQTDEQSTLNALRSAPPGTNLGPLPQSLMGNNEAIERMGLIAYGAPPTDKPYYAVRGSAGRVYYYAFASPWSK